MASLKTAFVVATGQMYRPSSAATCRRHHLSSGDGEHYQGDDDPAFSARWYVVVRSSRAALYDTGRIREAERVCPETAADVQEVERAWGDAAGLAIARLAMIHGRLAHRSGDLIASQRLLRHAVTMSRIWGFRPNRCWH